MSAISVSNLNKDSMSSEALCACVCVCMWCILNVVIQHTWHCTFMHFIVMHSEARAYVCVGGVLDHVYTVCVNAQMGIIITSVDVI